MLNVVHGMPIWLPQTQPWVYWQVLGVPAERIRACVVCENRAHEAEFPYPRVDCARDRPRLLDLADRAVRRLGLRPYLGHLVGGIRRAGARVLHSHFGDIGWRQLGAARRAGVAHVVTFYGYDVNLPGLDSAWQERFARLFSEADLFLCEGRHMARCLEARGCPPHKVAVQHLGVPMDRIGFQEREREPGAPLKVLIAATFTEKKGIPFALEALALASAEVPVEVTVIGDARPVAESEREKARILEVLARTGLSERTRLLGFQTYEVFLREARSHHVFLSPSVTAADGNTEGGAPVSLIDMAACGLPIVSSFHCDIPEIVVHGETGLLAAERDVQGLAAHLVSLARDPALARVLARAGRRRMEMEYDAHIQGERLAAHYERVAEARH